MFVFVAHKFALLKKLQFASTYIDFCMFIIAVKAIHFAFYALNCGDLLIFDNEQYIKCLENVWRSC